MSNETNATIEEIMQAAADVAKAEVMRNNKQSSLLVGMCERKTAALLNLVTKALDSQARQIEALTAERDELRKQLDDAKPATPAPGDWIEWHGGECPIADGVWFEFRFRDGELSRYARNNAPSWDWSDRGIDGDIIAYRILP